MVLGGFMQPVDFLMIFCKAVLRVHRSVHHITFPQSRHPQHREEPNPSMMETVLEKRSLEETLSDV